MSIATSTSPTRAAGVRSYQPEGTYTTRTTLRFAPTTNDALAEMDDLRTRYDLLGHEVREGHQAARGMDLRSRTVAFSKRGVAALLEILADKYGMGWSQISEVVGVSVSAVRKWRRGEGATEERRRRLSQLVAVLELLEEKGCVEDPAGWMEMLLPLGPGFFVRPMDLYLDGFATELLDFAEGRQTAEQMLDTLRPDWRDRRSKFEVYTDEGGERLLRLRKD